MTDDTTPKVLETHPVSKKYPLPIMVVMVVVLVIIIGFGMYKKTPPNLVSDAGIIPDKQEQKWGLCWEDHEEKRCGVVKNIVFHGSQKQIIKMEIYYPSTGVTTEFFRDPNCEVGIWVQHGKKKGEWILSPTQEGEYIGEIIGKINRKKWRATLVVEKLIVH